MNTDSLKAALAATASQVVALLVGYGIVNNQDVGNITAVTMGAINIAFLIAHAWHAQTAAKKPTPAAVAVAGSK